MYMMGRMVLVSFTCIQRAQHLTNRNLGAQNLVRQELEKASGASRIDELGGEPV